MYHVLASGGRVNEAGAILLLSQKYLEQSPYRINGMSEKAAFILFLFAASLARMGWED